jgi:hypothetical protein
VAHLLGGEPDALRPVHGLNHALRQ